MASESLTLVVNPGSASRKYAVFGNGHKWASINFEFVDGKIIGSIEHAGESHSKTYDDTDLNNMPRYVMPLLHEYNVVDDTDKIAVIGVRIVAPSKHFVQDELVTAEIEAELDAVQQIVPLHITTELLEIKQLKNHFDGVPIIAISDSAFHASKPEFAWRYGIDVELADRLNIKRFGYHGVSIGSVVRHLDSHGVLLPKTIVCHLGSGSSVTAVSDGKSIDTSMGYTPLEGLVMASRSGSIDVAAALAIKRELNLSDDGLERYLNKQCGLLGISGSSNDIRQLLENEALGDEKARLALQVFVYHVQQAIGQMAAALCGVDCVVFTGTVGERSSIIRGRILDNLGYLDFHYDQNSNNSAFEPVEAVNIGSGSSKPILVISTDEAVEIARRAEEYIRD